MAEDELKQWIFYMETMMGSIDSVLVKPSTIFEAPERLRRSRMDSYRPKMVSIGPLHRGTNPELLYMEEVKWHCVRSLLHRTTEPEEKLRECSEIIYNFDNVVRAVYVPDIKFNRYDLARIMLLDGCFLLELLISNDNPLNNMFPSTLPGPGAKVGKLELVLSDLKLIENQIPLVIVTILYHMLFSQVLDPDQEYEKSRKVVNGLVLSLFGCGCYSSSREVESGYFAHFLEIMHRRFVTGEEDGTDNKNNNDISITVDQSQSDDTRPKLKRCAARLEAAGVTIQALGRTRNMFGCDKSFRKQGSELKLEIQPLHITDTTEAQWRNLIAWEQNRITHEKFKGNDGSNRTRTGCNFSEHALLFRDLICCEDDIELLKERQVLIVHDTKRITNQDLMSSFREIGNKLEIDTNVSSEFVEMINELNTHSSDSARGYWCGILCHICRSVLMSARYGWSEMYVDLKQNHTATVWQTIGVIAATLLLLLTVAQTTFGALSL